MDWDEYFFGISDAIRAKSKDESTKVGCVIVGPNHEIRSTGYNSFPRGVIDSLPERQERPLKYSWKEALETSCSMLGEAGVTVRVALRGD